MFMSREFSFFVLEPADNFLLVELPLRSFNTSGRCCKFCLINMAQQSHVSITGQELAAATLRRRLASEVESESITVSL